MLRGGLVSVSFRKLSPAQIIDLVARSGLKSIEWGGDVHVPHGDLKVAREVKKMTRDKGLIISSYGSYYRVAGSEAEGLAFERALNSARELDAPILRVWAGNKGSADADEAYWQTVVEDSDRIANLAAQAGINVAYEFHGGTLTDTNESAIRLLNEVNHPNIYTYWQPTVGMDLDSCLEGLKGILDKLILLHVFHWEIINGQRERLQLEQGKDRWHQYFTLVKQTGRNFDALIEFVKGDTPEQFLADAKALKSWLDKLNA
ncbi:sugar phosphate isomerase/epimerase [candidate division KSB1 bacterium]|nr:sugar phosphate isomerase/epimerase [candidate division KSB1 bacterium]